MRGDETTASLVIVESGGTWPRFAAELQRRATHAIVESQSSGEPAREFVARVARRLQKLAAAAIGVEVAVIATCDLVDAATLEERKLLSRTILAPMVEAGAGELILSATEDLDDDAKLHLFSLAGTLLDELGGAGVGVRVRFTSASQSSIRAVRTSDPDIGVADIA